MTDPSEDTLDEILDILSDSLRRRLLRWMATQCVGRNDEASVQAFLDGREDRERNARELHHLHLPKLESRRYIDWDRERETVTPGPQFDEAVAVLDRLEDVLSSQAPNAT